MCNRKLFAALAAATIFGSLLAVVGFTVSAQPQGRDFRAGLDGFQEVPTLSMPGTGSFKAKLNATGNGIEYELSYSGLSATATAAHIHLGQKGTNGGVIAFLCDTVAGNAIPDCPATSGTVTGTLTASSVVGPASQGIAPGEFDEFMRAMREGVTYANVHSTMFPGGEIRGQIND
ncbi:MAG: CHRD domain-containing protein [Thaumarchaeota archaeon]|nr:CHRD domain-containing protein [Nitrososphaerota archaeon]